MRKVILVLALTTLMSLSVPSMAATRTVTALGSTFIPPVVVASPTDTIELKNMDGLPHTLTLSETAPLGGKFCRNSNGIAVRCDTGSIGPNGTGSFTLFSAPRGAYPFSCLFHFNMAGVLVVL